MKDVVIGSHLCSRVTAPKQENISSSQTFNIITDMASNYEERASLKVVTLQTTAAVHFQEKGFKIKGVNYKPWCNDWWA